MQANTYDRAMRIILFFLKCIVGVLATLGLLVAAAIAASEKSTPVTLAPRRAQDRVSNPK